MNRRRFIQLLSIGMMGGLSLRKERPRPLLHIDFARQIAWWEGREQVLLYATPNAIKEI